MKTTALIALFLFAAGCKNPEAQQPSVPPTPPPVAALTLPPPPPPAPPAPPLNVTPDASLAAPPAMDASAATTG